MAKISLRAYNREIETLIEHGNHEQAIAHCRHILSIYNKYIYTYRLLGKAYLESQRFGDASDIFQRVLSTLPDDFISQVGMSIIREDEGTLDEAIWHMERAYEVQPANNAIQRELQRLYGKRDGIEPPKIRLTRAALARMYIKGELYEQAINELRPTQDPITQRPELYVLLAQVYYLSGKRVDAAQVCNQLLKRLPFCFEANRILTTILTESDRADEAKSYRQRLIVLDPYAAHTSPASPVPDDVPDSAVSLEKLDWNPDLSPADMLSQPEWASSLGVEIENEQPDEESLPEWLDEIGEPSVPTEVRSEESSDLPMLPEDSQEMDLASDGISEQSSEDDSIPSWMKDAGWEASSGSEEDIPELTSADNEEETLPDDLAPAELPDWVQAIAPSEDILEGEVSSDDEQTEIEAEDLPIETSALPWLEETPPGPTDTVASWLEEKEPQVPEDAELELDPGEPIEIPDWLQDLKQDDIPPVPAGYTPDQEVEESLEKETLEQVPDEVSETELDIPVGKIAIGAAAGIVAATQKEEEPVDQELDEALPESVAEVPDQLEVSDGLEREEQPAIVTAADDEIPEWLEEPDAEPSADSPELVYAENQVELSKDLAGEEVEDTIEQVTEEVDLPMVESTPQLETIDEVPEGENELTTDFEVEEEQLLATPVEKVEAQIPQDMVGKASDSDEDALPLAPEDETPTTEEDDEAFAWLEGLAVKQGVDEALLLSSDEHQDKPPEWVQADAIELSVESELEADQVDHESELDESIVPKSDETAEELPEWLMGIQPSEKAEAEPGLPETTEIPDWLKQAEITSSESTEPEVEPADAEQEAELAADIPDWLKSSAAVAGVSAVAAMSDDDTPADVDDSLDEGDIAEWLSKSEVDQPETVEALDSKDSRDIPEASGAEISEEEERAVISDEEMLSELASLQDVSGELDVVQYEEEPSIEVSAITDEDTKPIRITPVDEVPIPAAMTETSPVDTVEVSLGDEIQPEAQDEGLPDWIQDLSEELELTTDTPEPIDKEETPIEEGVEWVPELPSEEISVEEDEEAVPVTSEIEEESSITEPEVEATESLDDEDAFAWLEGLAAKHGAEEAMLLEPEDRQETPPEWVQAEGEVVDTTTGPDLAEELAPEIESTESLDTIIEGEALEIEEAIQDITPIASQDDLAVEDVVEDTKGEEVISEPEIEMTDLEPSTEESIAEVGSEVDEAQPELPPWLAGVEEESAVTETPEWTLTTEESETQEIPQVVEEEAPKLVNLNQAGLVELEHLPGVGFIKAQAIIEYRESVGHFTNIDDLQNVSGIGPALIEEISDLVIVDAPEEDILDLPTDEHQVALIQARNALIEGDINKSLEHYNKLIQSSQMLADVIQDLNEALYRYPVDIGIWQALGDARMRSGQIQEALDAYTKAEELLR